MINNGGAIGHSLESGVDRDHFAVHTHHSIITGLDHFAVHTLHAIITGLEVGRQQHDRLEIVYS